MEVQLSLTECHQQKNDEGQSGFSRLNKRFAILSPNGSTSHVMRALETNLLFGETSSEARMSFPPTVQLIEVNGG